MVWRVEDGKCNVRVLSGVRAVRVECSVHVKCACGVCWWRVHLKRV